MPALASRGSARGRRAMNEINMVPFIDVMLVLLIIFMVTAPLIATSVVDLPTVGKAQQKPTSVVEIIVGSDERLRLRLDQQEPMPVTIAQLVARVREKQAASSTGGAELPVVISADRNVKYDIVVRVLDTLQKAGVKRVGLSVKQGG